MPLQGARLVRHVQSLCRRDFNQHVPGGARLANLLKQDPAFIFQSPYPMRSTTTAFLSSRCRRRYFNPCATRGARPLPAIASVSLQTFQPTCPARSTTDAVDLQPLCLLISTHVPRAGHDYGTAAFFKRINYFNPRAPRRARRIIGDILIRFLDISIPVPRAGHDTDSTRTPFGSRIFQSSCPARARLQFLLSHVTPFGSASISTVTS